MGTVIALAVGGIEVDWAKNGRGDDHGFLFQQDDRKRLPSDQINYDGVCSEDPELADMEMAFAKNLGDLRLRLELLGFRMADVEREYRRVATACLQRRVRLNRSLSRHGFDRSLDLMAFGEFKAFVEAHPIAELDDSYHDHTERTMAMGRFGEDTETRRIPDGPVDAASWHSERSCFGSLIGILHPYSVLRLLAESEKNRREQVTWQYGPLVDAGWASKREFVPNARRNQTFLIVTEGSSDAHILRHALSLLRPEIVDFFRFVDMREGYPFSGAGNLVRFAQGLSKIDVHNQIVFLLDNDCEGVKACQEIERLSLHRNMRALVLPELGELRSFRARGPDGVRVADINGRAAAIECYLDLEGPGLPLAEVVWTSYKREVGSYQGALENKEIYAKAFLGVNSMSLRTSGYDVSKIEAVLDAVFESCCTIAADTRWSRDGIS